MSYFNLFRHCVRLALIGGLVTAVACAAPQPAPAADPEPVPLKPVPKDQARELVRRFLRCWETGDATTFASLLHPDLVFAYPGGRYSRATLLKTFEEYQKQKKDIKIYFADFFVSDGARHITAYQFAATDRQSGQRFAVGTGVICRISEGKIVEFKEYWDSEVAGRQKAGDLPLDEGKVTPWPASVQLRPETVD